eukprot:941630_1
MSTTLGLIEAFNKIGYINVTKIADTLQGHLYKAVKKSTKKEIVIKITNKILHENSIGIVDNRKYAIKENILSEASILKHITQSKNMTDSIIKFLDFFECAENYYLVMDHGGLN